MNQKFFQKIGISTIIAVYFLIFVGGIVRSTGSGMGCPDWPRCFGQWIPPTDIKELPSNYKDIYAQKRKDKNEKLAKYLDFLGWHALSVRITQDKAMYEEADFNALKTWIEYINRLIGVLIGFLIIATTWFARSWWKEDKRIFGYSFLALVLVLVQGWLGSIVVSTNLLTGIITLHMFLAIVILFALIYALMLSYPKNNILNIDNNSLKNIKIIVIIGIILSFIQIYLGTQVRESIDEIAKKMGEAQRHNWVAQVGNIFYIHRSFSWLVLFSQGYLFYLIYKAIPQKNTILYRNAVILLGCTLIEFLSGVSLAYLGMSALLQPLHLTLAIVVVGSQFVIWAQTSLNFKV
jgi:heme a synthase